MGTCQTVWRHLFMYRRNSNWHMLVFEGVLIKACEYELWPGRGSNDYLSNVKFDLNSDFYRPGFPNVESIVGNESFSRFFQTIFNALPKEGRDVYTLNVFCRNLHWFVCFRLSLWMKKSDARNGWRGKWQQSLPQAGAVSYQPYCLPGKSLRPLFNVLSHHWHKPQYASSNCPELEEPWTWRTLQKIVCAR